MHYILNITHQILHHKLLLHHMNSLTRHQLRHNLLFIKDQQQMIKPNPDPRLRKSSNQLPPRIFTTTPHKNNPQTRSRNRTQPNVTNEERRYSEVARPENPPRFSLSSDSRRGRQEDFNAYLEQLTKQMTEKKDKLQKYIKIFNMMQSQNSQVKCLEHNNTLSIYCQSERKSLCANCVYGFNRHRTHKLIPLKDATSQILDDNENLWRNINVDLKIMDDGVKITQDNTISLQNQLKIQLHKAETTFNEKVGEMKAKYLFKKKKIQESYNIMIEKSKNIEIVLEEFKFKVWQVLSKIGIGKHSQHSNSELQIGKQVICMNMAQLTQINIKTINPRDIQKINHRLSKI